MKNAWTICFVMQTINCAVICTVGWLLYTILTKGVITSTTFGEIGILFAAAEILAIVVDIAIYAYMQAKGIHA